MRIKEIFKPSYKCERVGHKVVVVEIKVRKDSALCGAIVTDHKAVQHKCKRCGKVLKTDIGEMINWYSSCSMASDRWDEIRENGFCIIP